MKLKNCWSRIKFSFVIILLSGAMSAYSQSAAQQVGIARDANGKPDLSGIWQALNSANFNLEGHISSQGAVETLGAIGAITPGLGVVVGDSIPYLEAALITRQENFSNRRTEDPEAKCFLPGIPRATYMAHPFQIFQSDSDILMAYQYAGGVRTIVMANHIEAPVDSWMGWSNGHWEDDTLVVEVTGLNGESWLDRAGNFASITMSVEERYTPLSANHLLYEATITDPAVFERPWTIRMPLYRRLEENARLLEFKCVEFAEEMMYQYLRKPVDNPTGGE